MSNQVEHKTELEETVSNDTPSSSTSKEAQEKILTPFQMMFKRFTSNKLAVVAFFIFITIILFTFIGSYIWPYDPISEIRDKAYLPPSASHILGTDKLGRDVALRLLHGGKVSLKVGIFATMFATLLGTTVGLIAGFFGGIIDQLLMRTAEIIRSIPTLPLLIVISFLLGFNASAELKMNIMIMIFAFTGWTGLARLVRGSILSLKELDFVIASKALGIKVKNQIIRHMLPNVLSIVIISATLNIAGYILSEATLSYLGFGADPAFQPSWGNMLSDARNTIVLRDRWWIWLPPGLLIFLSVLSVNLMGEGIRDAIDPKGTTR